MLLVKQTYSLSEAAGHTDFSKALKLTPEKEIEPEWFDTGKPKDVKAYSTSNTGRIFLSFTRNPEQEKVLKENMLSHLITYMALLHKRQNNGERGEEHIIKKDGDRLFFVPDYIEAETVYTAKVRAELQDRESEWSEEAELTTPEFSECCAWKECPGYDEKMKYFTDEKKFKGCNKNKQWWIVHSHREHSPSTK